MCDNVIHFVKTTIEHYIIQPYNLKVKLCRISAIPFPTPQSPKPPSPYPINLDPQD